MEIKPILRTTVGLQSLAIMSKAVGLIPKKIGKKPKSLKPKKMVKGFTDIIVGTSLIRPTAELVEQF